MKDIDEAKELAVIMLAIAKRHKRSAKALITNMNQPLGETVGNSLEVLEAVNTVKGNGPKDFTKLCIEISSHMADLSGIISYQEAKKKLVENIKKWCCF